MDFQIVQGNNGVADIDWVKSDGITNAVYLSIMIQKGTLFNKPNFGLDLSDIKKLTDDKIPLIQGRCEQALKWMVDIGKARSFEVSVLKNTKAIGRVDISARVIKADGTPVDVDTFRTVGGPPDGFTI